MRSGALRYWAGVAGAFALGWAVTDNIGSQRFSPRNAKSEQSRAKYLPERQRLNDLYGSDRQVTQGEELEAAITAISALANEVSEDSLFTKRLFEFALHIPPKEFGRVLDRLRKLGSKNHDRLRAELLGYWMELNAPAARAYLTALPILERVRLIGPAADAWARMDSEGLMSWLVSLPSHESLALRDTVRDSVAAVQSQRDPAHAVALLLESRDGGNGGGGRVELEIFAHWSKSDPVAAAQRALLLPGGKGRATALAVTMEFWLKDNRAAAIAWVQNISDPNLAREAGIKLTERLGLIDPQAAVKFAFEQGVADADTFYAREACKHWVERDQAGALAWAQSLPSSASRDITLARMLAGLAKSQPQTAARMFVAETGRGANMADAAQDIIQGLTKAGDGKTLGAFLEQFPEAEGRSLTALVVGGLASESDPSKILATGLQLPHGPARARWLEESVGWITQQRGLQQAQQALETVPAGPERNSFVATAVLKEFSMGRDIDRAVALAQTLPNGRTYIEEGVTRWLRSGDATAARNWLRQTRTLTEEDKQRVLRSAAAPAAVVSPAPTNSGATPTNAITRP
jgi:hypothetical protein